MIIGAFLILLFILVAYLVLTGAAPAGRLVEVLALGVIFLVFFAVGIYVGAALGVLGLLADWLLAARSSEAFIGNISWRTSTNYLLVAIPLFLLMGEILQHSGLAGRLYTALSLWSGRLPGGLLHTNILASAVFSAMSGSSLATTATIGSVALPYFEEEQRQGRGNIRIALGSICAGGALGQLIPPSIALIIYSLFTETSVSRLYAGGLVVGSLVAAISMLYIAFRSLLTSTEGPVAVAASWRVRILGLSDLIPTAGLIALVIGSIYAGWATPTEAAAIGVSGAFALSVLYRTFTYRLLVSSLRRTARTTAMMGLIIIAGWALNFFFTRLGLPRAVAETVAGLPFPPFVIMFAIIMMYLALGVFIDGLAAMIATVTITFPVAVGLGYDPVWFGVLMVMLVEVGLISPPDGMIMYAVQAIRRAPGSIMDVFAGVLPFMTIYILVAVLMLVFPGIVNVLN